MSMQKTLRDKQGRFLKTKQKLKPVKVKSNDFEAAGILFKLALYLVGILVWLAVVVIIFDTALSILKRFFS
jgi:hypothetical protein